MYVDLSVHFFENTKYQQLLGSPLGNPRPQSSGVMDTQGWGALGTRVLLAKSERQPWWEQSPEILKKMVLNAIENYVLILAHRVKQGKSRRLE